jgi:hypothetical protein
MYKKQITQLKGKRELNRGNGWGEELHKRKVEIDVFKYE